MTNILDERCFMVVAGDFATVEIHGQNAGDGLASYVSILGKCGFPVPLVGNITAYHNAKENRLCIDGLVCDTISIPCDKDDWAWLELHLI